MAPERAEAHRPLWKSATVEGTGSINDLLGAQPMGLGRAPPGAIIGGGSLPKEVIAKVIKQNLGGVRHCYEKELAKNPKLEGKITMKIVIAPEGTVRSSEDISSSAFPSKAVSDCVVARFKAMVFPKPKGGGIVIVNYPVIFKAN